MNSPSIYICGDEQYEEDLNPTRLIKRLKTLKCKIVNPLDMSHPCMNWTDSLDSRVELIKKSQVVYVLPNWKESIMARIELTVAMDLHKQTIFHPASNKEIKQILTSLGN